MFALLALVAVLHLTAKDNNKTFSAKPRTVIVVTVDARPRPGYRWWYDPQSIDGRAHLHLLSHHNDTWRFRASGRGRVGLWLRYGRGGRYFHAIRSFAATIRVR